MCESEIQRQKRTVKPAMRWDEHKPGHWILCKDNKPITGLRFEDREVHARRYAWDRKNYAIDCWNAHIRTSDGARHLTWEKDTPILEMQREIEELLKGDD